MGLSRPLGYGQLPLRDRPDYPLVLSALGQGLRSELSRTFGVTAELGEVTTTECDHRGDIHQQAAGPADRGLERLLAGTGVGKLCRVDQLLGRLQAAAHCGRDGLRQQQPGAGPDQISRQRGQPALNHRRFAAQTVGRVEMLLDQPGGPGHLPGGDSVPDRGIGQPALRVPGGRVPVQSRHPAGLFGLQAGAEQVGEQVMVAPPAAHLIQRDQEQPGPFGLLQQRLAARPAVTASHSFPDSRSSTEVSSKNVRTCSLWRSSTSSAR
jgi:hypothetical protein